MKLKTILISSLLACGAFAQAPKFFIGGSYGFGSDGEASSLEAAFDDGFQGDNLTSLELGVLFEPYNSLYSFSLSAEVFFSEANFREREEDSFQDDQISATAFEEFREDFENIGVMFNAKGFLNLTDKLSVFAGGGLGFTNLSVDIRETSFQQITFLDTGESFQDGEDFSESDSETFFVFQLVAGLEFKPVDNFGLFAQVRYIDGEDLDIDGEEVEPISDVFFDIGARFYF